MVDYNIFGAPINRKKKKKEANPFGGSLDFGPTSPKKQTPNLFNNSFSLGPTENPERDRRRSFSQTQKKEILYQQDNICAKCHKKLDPREVEFDHKKPWAAGGRTIVVNGRALCGSCHKIVTHNTKLKEVDKKREPKSNNIIGRSIFDTLPKRSGKNPFR